VQEVDELAADLGAVVVVGAQAGLVHAPVVAVEPVVEQLVGVRGRHHPVQTRGDVAASVAERAEPVVQRVEVGLRHPQP
jgi:hypothetical protein